jgi:hypothetical protein
MKNLILVKISPCIQLGHLYEHLFCHEVTSYFLQHNLFEYIDYELSASTHYSGFIVIDISFYTSEAATHADSLPTLTLPITEENINDGLDEIEAEKQAPLGYSKFANVLRELRELQETPWQQLDNLTVLDASSLRRKPKPLYITEGSFPRTRKLFINLVLNPAIPKDKQRLLLPLFRELVFAIGDNVQAALARSLSVYPQSHKFINSSQRIYEAYVFATYPEYDAETSTIITLAQDVVAVLQEKGGFHTMTTQLQNVDYAHDTHSTPNIEKLYDETMLLLGMRGWREIATMENIELLLKHMSIEVKFGRKKASAPLARS